MANKHRGQATVAIGGHEKKLQYDFNAIAELEDMRNKSISALVQDLQDGDMRFGFIRDALYCGMLWSNRGKRGFTKHAIGALMDSEELQGYSEAIAKCLMGAMGVSEEDIANAMAEAEEKGVDPTEPPKDGIGDNSSEMLLPVDSTPMNSGG